MGIGIGAKNATVPIYSAEMAPARIRGALVMFWQLWVVIGKNILNPICLKSLLTFDRRYFPRILRECHRKGCPSHFMASSAWICLHSIFHPHGRYLLLPGVTSLVDEAR